MDMDDLKESIARAMQKLADGEEPQHKAPPQDQAILAFTLQEAAQRHAKGCEFKVGDLVTPRRGYNLKQPGDPHVVLDIFPLTREGGSDGVQAHKGGLARIYNMRVLTAAGDDGQLVAFFAESYCYEAWAGDVARVN